MTKIFFLMAIVAMSIFSRGEDECVTTPIKAMGISSSEDISQETASTVEDGQRITYFINDGKVLRKNEATLSVESLAGLDDIKSIHSYKGRPFALKNNGDVYLWYDKENDWIEFGSSVRKLLVFEQNSLVALTESGELWAFSVRPGDENISYTNVIIPGLNGIMIPSYEEGLLDTAISGVENIVARDGDILIRDVHGQEKSYRSIGPKADDLDSEFIAKVMGNRFTCRFKGKEKDYPVEMVWFEKLGGTLHAKVSYKIQGAWFNYSPSYKIPLGELGEYRERGLSSPWVVSDFFENFIMPASMGGWALEKCFHR